MASLKVCTYYSNAGAEIPCVMVTGYDSGSVVTTTEGSIVTADIVLLNTTNTKLFGVTKTAGTTAGQWKFGV